ncbi:MAG: hypothetical protein U1C53_00345, partial [Candidatus Veblenbacteria bacterium]|nr:hypothetical protein [Candidatus Veblenbacteria bacterium]
RKIEEFVIQKTNEWRGPPFTDNLHLKKPYHEASVNDVQLGEGLRELEIGRPERLNKILDDMIEKCTKIDPSWESEITYLNEIKQFIDEYKSEY